MPHIHRGGIVFHRLVLGSNPQWDHLVNRIINAQSNQFAVTQNQWNFAEGAPPGVSSSRWCQEMKFNARWDWVSLNISPSLDPITHGYNAGYYLAQDIIAALTTGINGQPVATKVIVDEIKPNTGNGWYHCAYYVAWYLRNYRPDLNGRWGFWVPAANSLPGGYSSIWDALYWTLMAHGHLACQHYYNITLYRTHKNNYGTAYADDQLKRYMISEATGYYGHVWLDYNRTSLGSASPLPPVIAVGNGVLGTSDTGGAYQMMNRMMWAFKTVGLLYTPTQPIGGHAKETAGVAGVASGGVGSWKWQNLGGDGFWGTNSTLRDRDFSDAWEWYCSDEQWAAHFSARYVVP